MMKLWIHLSIYLVLFAAVAIAQDAPKGEVFGGYSFVRQSISPRLEPVGLGHANSNGWMAGGAGFFNHWLGIKAEINGVYLHRTVDFVPLLGPGAPTLPVDQSFYSYTFGPVVALRRNAHIQPFAHALFGAAHIQIKNSQPGDDTALAMQFGGGVDIPLHKSFAIRGQADWIQTRFDVLNAGLPQTNQNHFKVSAGIALRFGLK